LSARIVSSTSTGVRASVDGLADSVPALVTPAGWSPSPLHARRAWQRISSLETRSPEALRAFLEDAPSTARLDDAALALFARALDHDSTFTLAALSWRCRMKGYSAGWCSYGLDPPD
jgi:hypothetical protein